MTTEVNIYNSLIFRTLAKVEVHRDPEDYNDFILLVEENGTEHKFHHEQDCCESVYISDIAGDPQDLVGSPILMAEEVTRKMEETETSDGSGTWTFYKFATIKGSVDITWKGESNGYYSESVGYSVKQKGEYWI